MSEIDEIFRRLAEVAAELSALQDDDFASHRRLETERKALRAEAAELDQRKDEGRSTKQLRAELAARRAQLRDVRETLINNATQANWERRGAKDGETINSAMMKAQGSDSIKARVAEIEKELARR